MIEIPYRISRKGKKIEVLYFDESHPIKGVHQYTFDRSESVFANLLTDACNRAFRKGTKNGNQKRIGC